MLKLLGAFVLGAVVTAAGAWMFPASTSKASPVASASCTTSDDEEMPDPRALDSRLNALEREITSDAGPVR
jgi:hypothetical protein